MKPANHRLLYYQSLINDKHALPVAVARMLKQLFYKM